jgi:D-alanyl-lipoteichoic acid acyltransferase DltB (MBOAT superfamily)
MTFVQVEYLYFFSILFCLYWAARRRAWQNWLLSAASALFYGWVHPWWLVLLYVAAIIDYFAAIAMERWPHRKGLALTMSLTANLGLLGYYKYADFFLENVAEVLTFLGVSHSVAPIGVLLPAGISFYTFQSMAYSIDVYRGELKPRRNLQEYLLAVSFFAHLVAGPVQRASNLLMQAETDRRLEWARVRSGFALAMWGGFKKMVIADTISPYVDKVFSLDAPATPLLVAGTLGFTVQILADFSGYTDIARGSARMLGWELMENFKSPYLATSPSDFWRRWHISFSSWIRDYVYISLGGSRGSALRQHFSIWGAMLLSGLWHGAAWNFVLWGAYHATLQSGWRIFGRGGPKTPREHRGAVLRMFGFTVFGWFLFRENSVHDILAVFTRNPVAIDADQWAATVVMLAMTVATAVPLILAHLVIRYVVPRIEASPWYLPVQTTAWACFGIGMFVFVRMSATDFIYFQF